MAAPTPTLRTIPTGTNIPDGFKTTICPASNPGFQFWEKNTQPPGIDGGEAIDTTTMHNVSWRTMAARSLKTLTPLQITGAHSPAVTARDMKLLINVNQVWTVKCPNNDTIAFFGFLKSYAPAGHVEGTFPEATLTIVPTNVDTGGVEQSPVYTTGLGSIL